MDLNSPDDDGKLEEHAALKRPEIHTKHEPEQTFDKFVWSVDKFFQGRLGRIWIWMAAYRFGFGWTAHERRWETNGPPTPMGARILWRAERERAYREDQCSEAYERDTLVRDFWNLRSLPVRKGFFPNLSEVESFKEMREADRHNIGVLSTGPGWLIATSTRLDLYFVVMSIRKKPDDLVSLNGVASSTVWSIVRQWIFIEKMKIVLKASIIR